MNELAPLLFPELRPQKKITGSNWEGGLGRIFQRKLTAIYQTKKMIGPHSHNNLGLNVTPCFASNAQRNLNSKPTVLRN